MCTMQVDFHVCFSIKNNFNEKPIFFRQPISVFKLRKNKKKTFSAESAFFKSKIWRWVLNMQYIKKGYFRKLIKNK